eukprot:1148565-Pelagomonas_calceolata.AAC.2
MTGCVPVAKPVPYRFLSDDFISGTAPQRLVVASQDVFSRQPQRASGQSRLPPKDRMIHPKSIFETCARKQDIAEIPDHASSMSFGQALLTTDTTDHRRCAQGSMSCHHQLLPPSAHLSGCCGSVRSGFVER